jgi:periplasmic protein TonB
MSERWTWRALSVVCVVALTGLAQSSLGQPSGEVDERVYDLSPDMTPPRVTKRVNPSYKTTRGVRLEGAVTVVLVVSSKGVPRDVRVAKGLDKDVDQSAIDAVREWRFSPARKDDQPVAVRISLEIDFHSM